VKAQTGKTGACGEYGVTSSVVFRFQILVYFILWYDLYRFRTRDILKKML